MARCRIYLITYRRHQTLQRSLTSLLDQTFTDWVCELHNDDPTDTFPRQLVEELGDPRIQIVNHPKNLGATASFNLIFQTVPEEFVSLLEDDNWWDPNFLETMLNAMEQFPAVKVGWANMRYWREEADGFWVDTGKNIWDISSHAPPQLIEWGNPRQIFTALHSNGAMLVRSQFANQYKTPENTPFEAVEATRERAFHFPLLFVPQICANFAITRHSSRSNNSILWAQLQTLLAGSFLKQMPHSPAKVLQIWQLARHKRPTSVTTLFFACFCCPGTTQGLKGAKLADWLFFLVYCLKHPVAVWQISRAIATFPELWQFLDQQTACRNQEKELRAEHCGSVGELCPKF